ncbi:MAG TPA: P-loop NTPase, partial [Actinomycetales bacterium]|nr:P-loop NTPase [Actinomycetales bacterium]
AISTAQLLPNAEIVVITTPQAAAADVAERAGSIAVQTQQRIVGVIENMSWLTQADGTKLELFGSGGGETVAERLTETLGSPVDVIGQVPLDVAAGVGSDAGVPIVLSDPESPAAAVITDIARQLTKRSRGLAGRSLGISPL